MGVLSSGGRRGGWQGLNQRVVIADARTEGPVALDRLEAVCRAAGLADPVVLELRVVAEEVLTNIAKYAYEAASSPAAEVLVTVDAGEVVLEFRDQGKAFDPLAQPSPDLDTPLVERPLGGLGIPLVRALVEEARYVREGATNVLRLVKRRAER